MNAIHRPSGYLKNASVLMFSDAVLRLAGMGFRIYLAGRLGEEGVGLYQLVLAFYAVFITLATAGVSVAATRLVTEEFHASPATARGMMRALLWVALGLGLVAALLQMLSAPFAARYWIGDVRATQAIRIASLALPFMAVAAVLRGFFLARRRVHPNVCSQLIEQALRIGLVLWFLLQMNGAPLAQQCAVVLFGTVMSEAVSCGVMWLFYRKERVFVYGGTAAQTPTRVGVRIWEIVWPVGAGRVMASGLHMAENMLVPACLALYLMGAGGRTEALAQYGALKAMALPLLCFPMGVLGSLGTLLMPEITEAHVKGNTHQLVRLLDKMFVLTMYGGVLAGMGFFVFAGQLAELLYQSSQTGIYLRWLAPMAPLMYLENMVTGALKGLGEQKATFQYSAVDSLARILLVALLLPKLGILSFLGVMIASNAYTCVMNTRRLLRATGIRFRVGNWFVLPSVAAVAALLASKGIMFVLYALCGGVLPAFGVGALVLSLVMGGGVMVLVYLVLAWLLGLQKVFCAPQKNAFICKK